MRLIEIKQKEPENCENGVVYSREMNARYGEGGGGGDRWSADCRQVWHFVVLAECCGKRVRDADGVTQVNDHMATV